MRHSHGATVAPAAPTRACQRSSSKGQAARLPLERQQHSTKVLPPAGQRPNLDGGKPVEPTILRIEATVETVAYLMTAADKLGESARTDCAAAEMITAALQSRVVSLSAFRKLRNDLIDRALVNADLEHEIRFGAIPEVQHLYRQAEAADAARRAA